MEDQLCEHTVDWLSSPLASPASDPWASVWQGDRVDCKTSETAADQTQEVQPLQEHVTVILDTNSAPIPPFMLYQLQNEYDSTKNHNI